MLAPITELMAHLQADTSKMSVMLILIVLIPVLLYCFKISSRSPDKSIITLLVLGDLGHSPRMQYHAISLARIYNKVYFVGYKESDLSQEIVDNPKIEIVYVPTPIRMNDAKSVKGSIKYLLMGVWRVVKQVRDLVQVLLNKNVRRSGIILVQNPPAIPTLGVVAFISYLLGSKFITDWHNFGFTLMELRLRKDHLLVKIAKQYEIFLAHCAHGHLTVTKAMKEVLINDWKIKKPVHIYYDRAPSQFRALTSLEKINFKAAKSIPLDHPLLISSTSWTEDEDFTILLSALEKYEFYQPPLPKIIMIITGKGPLRSRFEAQINERKWNRVNFRFEWLSSEEYPVLVGCADLGICLHTSSSGLDLPMKVVDMFGCGVPVCAVGYPCLDELVKHEVNGFIFKNSDKLYQILVELLSDWPSNTENFMRLRKGVESTWGHDGDAHQQLASFLSCFCDKNKE